MQFETLGHNSDMLILYIHQIQIDLETILILVHFTLPNFFQNFWQFYRKIAIKYIT